MAVDFFARQARARRDSRRMLLLFALAVLGVVALLLGAMCLLKALWASMFATAAHLQVRPWPQVSTLLLGAGLAVLGMGAVSLGRMRELRQGGGALVLRLGAMPVPTETADPVLRRVRNVVEEVAIAAAVPVPEIYLLEREPGINAFVAGYTPADAAICLTRGCLDVLTRDELQGVVAHEFSHIVNGDMRLNVRLVGLLAGVFSVAVLGRALLPGAWRSTRRRRDDGAAWLPGLLLVAIGYAGYTLGRLVQASVARSRESLADAAAVQFTRQRLGLIGALEKIAALGAGSRLESVDHLEVAHLLFGEGGRRHRWFATHPGVRERIRALGMPYRSSRIARLAREWGAPVRAADGVGAGVSVAGLMPVGAEAAPAMEAVSAPLPDGFARLPVHAGEVALRTGQPRHADLAVAGRLHREMPAPLRAAAGTVESAPAMMLALAMSDQPSLRDAQLLRIDNAFGSDMAERVESLLPPLSLLHPMLRLPLCALAFPQLKRRPRAQLRQLQRTLAEMVQDDGRVSLAEYCLVRLLAAQLQDALDPAGGFRPGALRLYGARADYAQLVAVLAAHGHEGQEAARRAWLRAMHEALPGTRLDFAAAPANWQPVLDRALARLDRVRSIDKELLVRGLVCAIESDGRVSVAEAELLRTVCAVLQCPLPPLLHDPAGPDADHANAGAEGAQACVDLSAHPG